MKAPLFATHLRSPLKPFLLAFLGAACLSLSPRTAYAQPQAITLNDILGILQEDIDAFEACHGRGHLLYDLIITHQAKALESVAVVRALTLISDISLIADTWLIPSTIFINRMFEAGLIDYGATANALINNSLSHARQAFELLEQYPCPPGDDDDDDEGSGGDGGSGGPGPGGSSGGDGAGSDGAGADGSSADGSSSGGNNSGIGGSGSGCNTANGPFGLVALVALAAFRFVRRKSRSQSV